MSCEIKQNGDGSTGLAGVDQDAGAIMFVDIPYSTTSPLSLTGSVVPRSCIVQSVALCPDVASTNAVTATLYQAPSGTLLASGTAVSGAMALNGAVGTNVAGALNANTQVVNAGSRVGVVISGALGAAGSGVVTVGLTPR